MDFKVKAGRFLFDKQTKKVSISKQKGLLHILRNSEQETHFKWANLDTHLEQLDIIVFAGDAVFEPVAGKNNTFVLRFGMDDDRYFFWLQEKVDVDTVVREVNRLINYEEGDGAMVDQGAGKVEQKVEQKVDPQPQPEKKVEPPAQPQPHPHLQPDFIAKIAQGLAAATKKHHHQHQHQHQETALTHLSQIITPQALTTVLSTFTPAQTQALIEFMPEQHKDAQHVPSSLRSPQFLQAMDVLSDALNSENALPLFMEIGLKQDFLQKFYGVQAFLLALVEKFGGKKEEKEEKKEKKEKKEERMVDQSKEGKEGKEKDGKGPEDKGEMKD